MELKEQRIKLWGNLLQPWRTELFPVTLIAPSPGGQLAGLGLDRS